MGRRARQENFGSKLPDARRRASHPARRLSRSIEHFTQKAPVSLRRTATALLPREQLPQTVGARLFELLRGGQIRAEMGDQFRPDSRPRHLQHTQRTPHQPLTHRDDFPGVDIAPRFRWKFVDGDAPRPTRIGRETAGLKNPHRPQPFIQTGGSDDNSSAQAGKTKTTRAFVKPPASSARWKLSPVALIRCHAGPETRGEASLQSALSRDATCHPQIRAS
ncbi:MAG: hypothetical protein RIQ93_768 [Verrucomicrobiota bacterium]